MLIIGAAVWIVVDGTTVRRKKNIVAYADIHVLDYGTITVALDGVNAPNTVQNFILLAQQNFYDGVTFHRIMDGFMMQGGDPEGNGSGGPGWTSSGSGRGDVPWRAVLAGRAGTGEAQRGGGGALQTIQHPVRRRADKNTAGRHVPEGERFPAHRRAHQSS